MNVDEYFLITTVQFFDKKHKNAKLIESIVSEVDCIALDECNRGGESQSFDRPILMWMSVRFLRSLPHHSRHSIAMTQKMCTTWSYEVEQKAKLNGEAWAQKAPRMVLRTKQYNRLSGTGDYRDGTANSISSVFSLNALTFGCSN